MLKIIVIGDPHFKVDNIIEANLFIEKMVNLVKERQPDLIVILGDVLHEHERIHTIPLNKAYEFIEKMSEFAKTFVLVGNHDYTNNQQYLTTNHWMNAMKKWSNVFIIDETFYDIIDEQKIIFVPYVAPGRFEEAMNSLKINWKDASCIFAHQEFYGCKMGAIISEVGDKWPEDYPNIISGHIHSNQRIQKNIYYPGSAMQNAFGESEKNIISYIELNKDNYYLDEIDLDMPRKKIVYMDVEKIDDYNIPENCDDKIKVSIAGDYEEFKTFKKTKKYKELVNKGVRVVFKAKKKAEKIKSENLNKIIEETKDLNNFREIITNIINSKKDPYLLEIYERIINNNIISSEDVVFI